ncbi:hypothetical protein P7K49_007231, partial [Saguinus oedipus]
EAVGSRGPGRNGVILKPHFPQDWQRRVDTRFTSRRGRSADSRPPQAKGALHRPVPSSRPLRPLARCPPVRYQTKVCARRGCSLEEPGVTDVDKN